MEPYLFIKKIKNYAFIAFLLPLITLYLCLLIYQILGNSDVYHNLNWSEKKFHITIEESYYLGDYRNKIDPVSDRMINFSKETFINCPKYNITKHLLKKNNKRINFKSVDVSIEESAKLNYDEIQERRINILKAKGIFFVVYEQGETINDRCIKNHPFHYAILNNFSFLEKILIDTKKKSSIGFAKVVNPFIYGEVSISRTARYFPSVLIFKPFIILSAVILFLYWKNNLLLFNMLKHNNVIYKFSKKFFYLGLLSCILLILHSVFLGIEFESKPYRIFRRSIITLFILSEVFAQIFLTRNLYIFREKLNKYIRLSILRTKIIFVSIVFFITIVSIIIFTTGNPSSEFKHFLEWNYFVFLLLYYFLSRLIWKPTR